MLRYSGFAVFAALLLQGCQKEAPAPAPPPPAVTVAYPVQREVIEWDTYTGLLEAPESVNVMARVSGLIVAAPFSEGAIVKKGDVLYEIDVRPFKADLESKIADQEKAQAELAVSQSNFDRQVEALKAHAVSQQDYDNSKATRDQANAALASAKAAVELSRLNVEWCQVTSPINGRVSNKMVTIGNLVNGGAGQATLLTTIQSVTPLYCYVDVDEHSILKYQKLSLEGKRVSARDTPIPCYVQLGNETGFPHMGVVDFVDNHIDPGTGTLRARGVFQNKTGLLTPGFFASLRVAGSGRYQTLLVPDTAIGIDQNERDLLIVNKDDIVEARTIEPGALFGELRSITSGLKPDDRVIINGQMHARAGGKVAPTQSTIQIDPSAFAEPGSPATQALPTTTQAAEAMKAIATSQPTTGTSR
ncbi:MAG TPA: efflux RND transporter periplasmic adaptor subunit [Tepidisphaeraceae bacterium]|nr:efflux RND transporter periplasmic adaptor subunit [Tepidisphaeraceae bacterium]